MKQASADRCRTYQRALDGGLMLSGEVSPCVFIYHPYPLQVTVALRRHTGESLGVAYAVDQTKNAETYSVADVERLLANVRVIACRRCANPAFDPRTIETNRAGLCEACFVADLNAELAKAEEAERKEILARDRRMKKQGMAVRVSAWVHPSSGGDDYQIDWYLEAHPTPRKIREMLRGEGSSVLDDYQIVNL